jgi:hypothetical protein
MVQRNRGTLDEIANRSGHEHLSGTGRAHDSRRDMNCDATYFIAAPAEFHLTAVEPGPHLQSKPAHPIPELDGATNGRAGRVEGGEDPVTRVFDQSPAVAPHDLRRDPVVAIECVPPPSVAHLPCPLRGVDDIGEQDGGDSPPPRAATDASSRDRPARHNVKPVERVEEP